MKYQIGAAVAALALALAPGSVAAAPAISTVLATEYVSSTKTLNGFDRDFASQRLKHTAATTHQFAVVREVPPDPYLLAVPPDPYSMDVPPDPYSVDGSTALYSMDVPPDPYSMDVPPDPYSVDGSAALYSMDVPPDPYQPEECRGLALSWNVAVYQNRPQIVFDTILKSAASRYCSLQLTYNTTANSDGSTDIVSITFAPQ